MKNKLLNCGLSLLACVSFFSGCTQQMADTYSFNKGLPNSKKMFNDLSVDKEISNALSKDWQMVDYSKDGITTVKEEVIKSDNDVQNFFVNYKTKYENSLYVKKYYEIAKKRGNTIVKYNDKMNKKALSNIDRTYSFAPMLFNTASSNDGTTMMQTYFSRFPIFIEFDKNGRIVSALGSYTTEYGHDYKSADCYHTFITGGKAKILEVIFTKKELDDNLAF